MVGEVVAVARTSDGPVLRLSNNYVLPFRNVDIMQGQLAAG